MILGVCDRWTCYKEPIGTTWETWNFEKIKNNIKRNKEKRPKYEIVVHQDRVNCQHLENKKDQRSILFDNIEAVSVQQADLNQKNYRLSIGKFYFFLCIYW